MTTADPYDLLLVLLAASVIALLLFGVARLGLRLLRLQTPSTRHSVLLTVLVAMLLLPALRWGLPALPLALPAAELPTAIPSPVPTAVEPAAGGAVALALETSLAAAWTYLPWAGLLLAGYALGVAALGARLALSWGMAWQLTRSSRPADDGDAERLVQSIAGRPVGIAIHESVRVPLVTGWRRPTLLLPSGFFGWQPAVRQAALVHEALHVRRRDYLVQLLAAINRCFYWFHPLAWRLPRQLAELAEQSCDRAAAEIIGNTKSYARALLWVAAHHGGGRRVEVPALAMASGDLQHRLDALLSTEQHGGRRARVAGLGLVGLVLTSAVLAAPLAPVAPTAPSAPLAEVPEPPPAPTALAETIAPTPPVAPAPVVDLAVPPTAPRPPRPLVDVAPAAPPLPAAAPRLTVSGLAVPTPPLAAPTPVVPVPEIDAVPVPEIGFAPPSATATPEPAPAAEAPDAPSD